MIVYRDLDNVPEIPAGLFLYRADMTSGIPDDDGEPSRFDRWCLAASSEEALATFEAWADDVHEGIVINDVEREIVT